MKNIKFKLNPKKRQYADKKYEVVRVSAEAYNALIDMANESTCSIMSIASKAILFAQENVSYEEGEENG
ncbi:MAG: hypothetical protein K0R34_2480 [Herbinix sp.]|jgi:predicted DNA binding protein|nr:hypothetical protein [Herbinix sp.]